MIHMNCSETKTAQLAIVKTQAASKSLRKWKKKALDVTEIDLDDWTMSLVSGHLDIHCPNYDRIVRIFTSSTFTGEYKEVKK